MTRSGLFVSFEGGDGAGKTTLMDRIEGVLQLDGIPFVRTREPGGTRLGEELRHILLHSTGPISPMAELGLFLASRSQHIYEVIQPSLQANKVVLCDRFNDSTVAYQGFGRDLGWQKVQQLCELFCGSVLPQLSFYLDLDPQIGLDRVKRNSGGVLDRVEAEHLDYHQKVRRGFLQIAAQEPQRMHVIDANRSPDEIFAEVLGILREKLP